MKLPKFSFRKKSKSDPPSDAVIEDVEEKNTGPAISSGNNSGGAKQWLILHLEKICFAAAIMLFAFLVYNAVGRLSVNPKQNAEKLLANAEAMEDLINKSDGDGSKDEPPDFAAQVEKASKPIENNKYSFKSLVGIESQKLRKRSWPKFLPAEDIWVEGGSGVFWIAGKQVGEDAEMPDETVPAVENNSISLARDDFDGQVAPKGATAEIKHWAAITAIIPVRKQKILYDRIFQEAEEYQPLQDVPNYLLARIKRIELTKDNEWGKNLDWAKPDLQWEWTPQLAGKEVAVAETALGQLNPQKHDRWAVESRELVDARHVHPRLTTPLGPLGYVGWHQWATHPDIQIGETKATKVTQENPQTENARKRKPFNRGNNRGDSNRKIPDREENFGDFSDEPQVSENQTVGKRDSESKGDESVKNNGSVSQKLLRLFDFDVKPGRTYVYKVQLLLKNPNYDKPSRILRDPAHRKSRFIPDQKLPWSKQSAPVYIPPLSEVYAAVVPEPTKKEATVIIKTPNGSDGGLLIRQLTLPQGGMVAEGALVGESSFKIDGLAQKLTQGDDPLDAEFLLVDVRSQAPASEQMGMSDLLFLDANGEFQLRNTASVVDQRETQRFNRISKAFDLGMQNKKNKEKDNLKGQRDDNNQDDDKALLGGKKRNNKEDN